MLYYNSYRNYIRKRFGKPVLKIPLNGGFNCPNRDGTKSENGCHFCDNISFSPAANYHLPPVEQLRCAIDKASGFDLFIPYLQPFSNTYGSVDLLKSVYEPLLGVPGVTGLAIGTRPDCFTDDVFDYLGELSTRTYLSVEIGLQSSHDSTLELINRHHSFNDFVNVVSRLSILGIEVVTHVMLGLPGETPEMMEETADRLASLQVCGVKIHQLMVIKNTKIQSWYENGTYTPLSIESYAQLLGNFISRLRPDQHIHRIMADSKPEYGLIAPQWSELKNKSVNFLHEHLKKTGTVQGNLCKSL
ncbi:MAG TPA: TIGR01212 family radical SAM protein [Chitinispirillaceae bacterium]|nr:TIGR01212 family radical SAM protein [Chitinispirillaceae bacterium]